MPILLIQNFIDQQTDLYGGFMVYSKVEICGVNTNKIKTLKEKEKIELIKLSQSGDPVARDKLVNGNLKLVLSVVARFNNRGENVNDIFQVGCIGLIKAIDNFDLGHNVRFSTYAVPMILGEIRRYLRDYSPVKVSRSLKDLAYKALKAKEELTTKLGRDPNINEISTHLSVPKHDVVMALDAVSTPVSLYEPIYNDGGDTIYVMDQISGGSVDDEWIQEIAIKQAIKTLGDRERMILTKRFLMGKTQIDVAKEIGISQAQVSRIEKSALLKIKSQL